MLPTDDTAHCRCKSPIGCCLLALSPLPAGGEWRQGEGGGFCPFNLRVVCRQSGRSHIRPQAMPRHRPEVRRDSKDSSGCYRRVAAVAVSRVCECGPWLARVGGAFDDGLAGR
ncbi:hypothetical protein Taro_007710, partial [Colocasia esculenta]|nr:hypothetical protein [Colocasia esculenta]